MNISGHRSTPENGHRIVYRIQLVMWQKDEKYKITKVEQPEYNRN
jgi:hypothetical protein